MNELSCRTVQRWLQAPAELGVRDAHRMDRHIQSCARCRAVQQQSIEVDRRVRETLASAPLRSVRAGVRAAILAEQQAAPPSRRLQPLTIVRAVAPVIALAAVLALVLTQLLPDATGNEPVAGAAWHPVRSNIRFALAADPVRPNHLLAGASGQVYESWDDGNLWKPLGALPHGLVVMSLAVDRTHPDRYLVATTHSVYVSGDRGRHWRLTAGSLQGARNMFLLQSPAPTGTFYLGPSILWHSTNRGVTWTPTGHGRVFAPYGIQALSARPDGTLYTAIWGGGVAVSHNGGVTWQRRATGLNLGTKDVTVAPNGALWAGTRVGPFTSTDGGAHWIYAGPARHFWTNTMLAGPGYLVAGGDGVIYRSIDNGKSWSLATSGLPLAPYVNSLVADPFHPGRIYASLDTDGLFRSDDAGAHWTAVNNGLALTSGAPTARMLLFLRGGVLWKTDGADPGNLTVEQHVRLATLSPDTGSVAYLEVDSSGWAVRLLAAGGSAAHTVLTGSDTPPHRLLWSPDSLRLAVVQSGSVIIAQTGRANQTLTPAASARLLSWTLDGRSLLLWNQHTHHVLAQSWRTGATRVLPFSYAQRPHPAPDGRSLAYITGSRLFVGTWYSGARAVQAIPAGCSIRSWADDSTRLLLVCGSQADVVSRSGVSLERIPVPDATWVSWLPGSSRNVLVFRAGAVWQVSPSGQTIEIVSDAAPVLGGTRSS